MINKLIFTFIITLSIAINIIAQSSLPNSGAMFTPKLGLKPLETDESKMTYTRPFPIDDSYEGKLISYSPYYNYNGKYGGRKYLLTDKSGTTIELKISKVVQTDMGATNSTVFDKTSNYLAFHDLYNTDGGFTLNQVFVEKNNTDELFFCKYGYSNSSKSIVQYKFYISTSFEYKINENIETLKIQSWKCGNNIFAFTAYSNYSKKVHLFVSKLEIKEEDVAVANLMKLDLGQVKLPNDGLFNYMDCTVHSIVQDGYGMCYLFLQFSNKVVPIKCFSITGKDLKIRGTTDNAQMQLGVYWELPDNEWSGNVCPVYDMFRNSIEGFVNYYSEKQDINAQTFKLALYDNSFKKLWEKNLTDIKISKIDSHGDFIIIGGYTKNKGYLGFPNPRIIIINKNTQAITYDKVIALKNASIKNITSDFYNNIELTVGIWSEKKNFRDQYQLTPIVILDKLNDNGVFENDLFQK